MDFSQLHTYTPPQCAPENTGYTYSLSSSYSTAALEFEKEHQIAPVYESPRMSRRSLRLQTSASHYGNENLVDYSQNHHSSSSSSYTSTSTRRETRHSLSSVNGDASTSKSHAALSNGYICRDCSVHSQKTDSFVTQSASSLLSSSSSSTFQAAEPSTDALSSTSSPFTSIYSRDRTHSSYCGSMNVKDLVTEDASHLNLNGSLLKAGKGLLWFLATGWYQLVSLMSLLNVFFLTRCLPKLWKLLLLLLPLLLLLGECLIKYLTYLASTYRKNVDMERLERVERQLALLWERVQQGDQKQEQRHDNILGLYSTLREQLHTQTDRDSLGLWVASLLDQRIGVLRGELEQENTQRAQVELQKQQQESQAARLADLELLLKALSAKTEVCTAGLLVGVKQEDHDALLTEVQRLEVELSKIRQDLQGVAGCKGRCEQLDTLQDTVSQILTFELQALFFGVGASGEEQGEVPESLIHWLSQRYVSTPDLQASLASLELSILRNISQQLEVSRTQTVVEAESRAKSIQVKLIVQNALKLYSQDRTGQVDYALESGGGSILSTRCSETYETKTALMSLFGLPLWYFSQSPRVVIQPDVYPGNCWAFKGSQGYLVIRLSLRILPTSFAVEHIPKTLSPTGNITSAPRNFTVFGLDDEYQEEGKLLGHYTYQDDGESLQIFPVMEENDKTFQIIEVRVLSNWGHPEYTCLYRFRVHGEPRPH
uniref:Sad1 and UNC84 domain containing 1b n=1 Tax=Neolamprologus brichardi TaxID=32507 RepID=A0A3Q4G4G7_NEOBR